MNARLVVPLAVVAVVITLGGVLALTGDAADVRRPAAPITSTIDDIWQPKEGEKIEISIYGSSRYLPLPDKISATGWIIEGKILNATAKEVLKSEPDHVIVHTIYTVEVKEVLRGEIDEKVISVAIIGGETERYLVSYDRHKVLPGEHFIMFLSKGGYCEVRELSDFRTIGAGPGLYLIEDGIAKNNVESESLPVDDLREEIAEFAGKPKTEIPGTSKTSGPCIDPVR